MMKTRSSRRKEDQKRLIEEEEEKGGEGDEGGGELEMKERAPGNQPDMPSSCVNVAFGPDTDQENNDEDEDEEETRSEGALLRVPPPQR